MLLGNTKFRLFGSGSIVALFWLALGLSFLLQSYPFVVESWSPPSTRVSQQHGTRPQLQVPRGIGDHPPTGARSRAHGDTRCFSSSAKSDNHNDDDDEAEFIEIESLSASQILELIELSFFQACYALSKGDAGPLRLFVIATKTAYKKYPGASGAAISASVDSLLPSVRPLDDREQSLRDTWIRAVYLVLERVLEENENESAGFESDDDDDEVAATYGPILADLVALHQTGMGLNANRFVESRKDLLFPEDAVGSSSIGKNILALEPENDDDDVDPVRVAVVTQTINVLYTTLVVLAEEQEDEASPGGAIVADGGEEEGDSSPKPSKSKSKKNKPRSKSNSGSGRGFG